MLESGDLYFHKETYYWYYHAHGPKSKVGYHFTRYSENPVVHRETIHDADALAEVHHLIRYPNIYVVFTYRRDNCEFEEDLGIVKITVNKGK